MLIMGIIYQVRFMQGLRQERSRMVSDKLVHGESAYPVSLTLIAAVLLLLIGLVAIFSIVTKVGPFQ
jgi:putative membrane protein